MNKIKNNESPFSKNKFMKLESKYISLINSLSFSIKELYLTFSKILKELNTKIFEQNNYIFTCKCLINEMNNKNINQEKFHNLVKNIEGINITNKYIIKHISDFDESSKNFFQNSKIIFKRMKELKTSNINIIIQKKIKYRNNLSDLMFSEENNLQPESFTTKTNNIKSNSNRKSYISLNKNKNIYEINTNDVIHLSKKILKGKNKKRMLNHSQDEIITDLTNNNLKKRNFFLDATPHKNISWSKEKVIPVYRNKNIFSLNNTNYKRYHKINNNFDKKRIFKTFKFDSSSEWKYDNNNLIGFIENIINYFYLLKVSQNMIINEPAKISHEKELEMKLKQNLIKLNYSIFIINDFFNDKIYLKRKLNYIISTKDNIEQKLKNLYKNNKQNDIALINNINKLNNFETNREHLIYSKDLEYMRIINKLKEDNNNLAIINQKIISQNKLLINQLSLFENNETEDISNYDNNEEENINNIFEKLIKENKEYKAQINNMKKDNEQLCNIIKRINNNNDTRTNSSYFLNNSQISNIINYNTDINNNNNNLIKKKKETENLKNLLAENKMLKIKLNEKEGRINNNDKLNKEFENLKMKSESYIETINEKNSLIKSLNLNINNLKNELNDTKNNYNYIKETSEKNKQNTENQIKQLKSLIEEKNIEIKKLINDKVDKDKKINEQFNAISKLNNSNKNLEKQKKEIMEKSEQQTQEISQLESIINVLNEKLKILGKKEKNEIINLDNNNNEIHSKRISTPSFKSPEEETDDINNLKKEDELLLNTVKKYETIFKNNNSEKANEENNKNIIKPNTENKLNNTNEIINNYVPTISSMKINKLYTSNEFLILSDVSFNQFKWYLMKRKSTDEEISEIDSYDNLLWVPVINIIDIEKFEYEELENTTEIFNLIKKLEEKENIISKLSYKLSKLERGSDNNLINIEENNEKEIDIKKSKAKSKSENNSIPIEKYNELLDRLNKFEFNLEKLKKENSELIKYKKLYLESNEDNNPINNINIKKKQKQDYSNSDDEIDYYKKKCEELQMLLNVFKEGVKNILTKLVIPKKDKGEIKQILKLFEFTKEETSIILGDKKI